MKAARIQLTPLTPEEQQFAETNHYLVEQFLYWNRLDPDDWYDVVIFRYLQSVKKWLMRPELHRYKFSSLLKQGLSSAVRNEKDKQARRIQTVSLDATIPGTEDATYLDVITADNLDYVSYGEYEEKLFKPKVSRKRHPDTLALKDFLSDGTRKMVKFTYDTKEEAVTRDVSMHTYRKNHGLQNEIRISREDRIITVLKIEGGKE